MRAVFNMSNFYSRGTRQLGMGIISGLREVGPDFPLLILAPEGGGFEELALPQGSDLEVIPEADSYWRRHRQDEEVVPKAADSYGADVVLGLTGSGPARPRVPYIMGLVLSQFFTRGPEYLRLYGPRDRIELEAKRRMFARALRASVYFTTLTEIGAQEVCRQFDYPRNRTRVIPNSVDLSRLDLVPDQAPHAEEMRNSDVVRCLMMCGFHSHKNFEVIPETMRQLSERLGRKAVCFFTVNPDAPEVARFLRKVESRGLSEYVRCLYPVPDEELGEMYRAADVFVYPTINELWSATYLDSMYCGLPMVTSDLPFARILCDDAALYVKPFDPADIAAKVDMAVSDTTERTRMIERGRERAKEIHRTWPEIAADYLDLIELGSRSS